MKVSDTNPISDSPERPLVLPFIPGYRVERRLGLGGMATVYLAVQESLDREVAIKVMRPSRQLDEKQTQRFEHEARIIAKLQHPSIMVIHEVGRTQQGHLYYVMPYLAKGDLSMRDYRDDEAGLIALLRALLDALGYAHARGIVHRDVKPENVLFDNADRPQLADFGIALSPREVDSRITGDGIAIGSGAQMSPEQARADKIDGRSDLYSLGVLTYELLTGELPFNSTDSLSLALMHAQDPVPRLPAEKAHWQSFIDRAMAKQPDQRFRNAQAMQRALEPIRRHARRAAGPIGRLRHAMSHRPTLLVATGLLLAISLISLALPHLHKEAAPVPSTTNEASANPAQTGSVGEHKDIVELNALAIQQISIGTLLTPAGSNAAETYLVMLRRDPDSRQAIAGIESVIGASIPSLTEAVDSDDPDELRTRYLQIELAADLAKVRDKQAFTELRATLRGTLITHIEALAKTGKQDAAMTQIELAKEFGFDDTEIAELETRVRNQPVVGRPIRDPGGEEFMLVPSRVGGSSLGKTFLMMRNEVSRRDYAEFAKRTKREASRCRNSLSPLRVFDRRSWDAPGFKQGASEPVVCVSYADANAYASWLSRTHGKKYRLPSKAEWLHAAGSLPRSGNPCALGNVRDKRATGGAHFDCDDGFATTAPSGRFMASALGINDLRGNAAEWTSSCTSTDTANCKRRAVLGMSWQDGPKVDEKQTRDLPADRGYDDVGFRLVRNP